MSNLKNKKNKIRLTTFFQCSIYWILIGIIGMKTMNTPFSNDHFI